ncbi:MAG: hypothetical protein H6618_01580 [Deltaproteobacteria bacterium]|nr:hypothetical protein [Deltaproteobacteria bacterium]
MEALSPMIVTILLMSAGILSMELFSRVTDRIGKKALPATWGLASSGKRSALRYWAQRIFFPYGRLTRSDSFDNSYALVRAILVYGILAWLAEHYA